MSQEPLATVSYVRSNPKGMRKQSSPQEPCELDDKHKLAGPSSLTFLACLVPNERHGQSGR